MQTPNHVRAVVFAFVVAAAPRLAWSDAPADLVAIEHARLPSAIEFLGWSADGTAFARSTLCVHSGAERCFVRRYRSGLGHDPVVTTVLETGALDLCIGHWQHCDGLTAPMRSRFVADDAAANAALPTLTMTPPVATPAGACGAIASGATTLSLHSGPYDAQTGPVQLQLVDARAVAETIATLGQADFIDGGRVTEARMSPDGRRVFVATTYREHDGELDDAAVVPVVVDVGRARAVLVNTLGFHAYRGRDLPGALALFRESTTLDPTFALGWYNRASVEARTSDAPAARASLQRAAQLDAAQAHHACVDHDFDTLRAQDGFAAIVACPSARARPAH